jgi:membrane associated rhomboid family serine protease
MKFSHIVTIFILVSIVLSAIFSIIDSNWGELGMCITAFAGWAVIARQEYAERVLDETFSR